MGVTIKMRGRMALQAKLTQLSPAIRSAAKRKLAIIGEHLASYGKEHYSDNGLQVRSGDLRRSEQAMPVEETLTGLSGGMMASQKLPYGPIQEFGGTIRATNATYLTIPIGEALTGAGVARFSASEAEDAGYHTFVRNHMIFGIKDGILYPLFILVPSVVIPARPFVGPILDANRGYVERQLKEAVNEGIRRAH